MYIIYDEVEDSFMLPSGSFDSHFTKALRFYKEDVAEEFASQIERSLVVIPVTLNANNEAELV